MKKKIVVIEDNHDILELLGFILENEDYEVLASLDAEPIKSLEDINPHLILLDENLGIQKGHQLCLDIKANPGTSHLPVILISAVNDLSEIARKCKADNYISKPFLIEDLLDLVRQHHRRTD
ncbi:MAG: response regulator [Daejeonella sp.]|uniref:response regulator n=1 Tax=Daejeonella sp. JGW-45 TaxID=3034148 RepID=UPI0023ED12BB|nr:response regulator [Daejeonella sp. JGW-45]